MRPSGQRSPYWWYAFTALPFGAFGFFHSNGKNRRPVFEPERHHSQTQERQRGNLFMTIQQIIVNQRAQKMQRAGSVGNGMINFQVDPAFEKTDAEQKPFSVRTVNGRAGRKFLWLNNRPTGAVLEIIPEQPFFENGTVKRKFFHGLIQCKLQSLPVHRLGQLARETKDFWVFFTAGGGEYLGRIVQTAPSRL